MELGLSAMSWRSHHYSTINILFLVERKSNKVSGLFIGGYETVKKIV